MVAGARGVAFKVTVTGFFQSDPPSAESLPDVLEAVQVGQLPDPPVKFKGPRVGGEFTVTELEQVPLKPADVTVKLAV